MRAGRATRVTGNGKANHTSQLRRIGREIPNHNDADADHLGQAGRSSSPRRRRAAASRHPAFDAESDRSMRAHTAGRATAGTYSSAIDPTPTRVWAKPRRKSSAPMYLTI